MPQYRLTWAKVVDSEDFNDLPCDLARVFWLLLPLRLDRAGRCYDDPQWLRSMIFPKRRDVTLEDIENVMQACENLEMVVRYEVSGKKYFYVPSFKKYQRGTDKEAKSVIPAPNRKPKLETPQRIKSGVSPEQVGSKSPSDADANTDTKADAVEAGAIAPPALEALAENAGQEKTRSKPDDSLLVSQTPGGLVLLQKYEQLAADKGRKSRLKHYANDHQRKAFEAVYSRLNGELAGLIDKGFAHNRLSVENMLSWLEGCVKRADTPQPLAAGRPAKQSNADYDRRWAERAKARQKGAA